MTTRREFLILGAPLVLGAVQDSLAGSGPAGKLWDPRRAGRSLEPSTAADNDAALQVIEKKLKCTCGCGLDVYTCRTTDFSCTTSPAMHREVLTLSERGLTADQILDDFVARHGQVILMAPPKRGFNLTAYFLPSIAILGAAAALVVMLRLWTRAAVPAPAAPHTPPPVVASAAELQRLRDELDHFSA